MYQVAYYFFYDILTYKREYTKVYIQHKKKCLLQMSNVPIYLSLFKSSNLSNNVLLNLDNIILHRI